MEQVMWSNNPSLSNPGFYKTNEGFFNPNHLYFSPGNSRSTHLDNPSHFSSSNNLFLDQHNQSSMHCLVPNSVVPRPYPQSHANVNGRKSPIISNKGSRINDMS